MRKLELLSVFKMNVLLFLVSFSMLIYCVNTQHKFYCYENFCSTPGNECPEFSCEDGRTVQNATRCGCCPLCIKTIKEDKDCKTKYYKWENKIAECGPGLICKPLSGNKGKCEPSDCLKRKKKYMEQKYATGKNRSLEVSFDCDHFGNYEASDDDDSSSPQVVCINDVLCFCVDKDGKRIFGTDFASSNSSLSNMKCDCSRDINDLLLTKTVDFERLPRCLPNGDYDPLQCAQNKCFCMDFRYTYDELVDAENIEKLLCYKDNRRPESNPLTKCLKQREEEIKYFHNKNLTIIGVDRTRCELDGTYYPLQCRKGKCSCVKRNGVKLVGLKNIKKEEGDLMCRCMRDKEIIESYEGEKSPAMKKFEDIKCDKTYTSDSSILSKPFINDFIKH